MENQALEHIQFNNLPFDLQLNILNRIDSRLAAQKIRSVSGFIRFICLPEEAPYSKEMIIPFFNNEGVVSSSAHLTTNEVFNCRDGGWVVQLSYNFDGEQSVEFLHPLTMLPLTHVDPQQRIFNPVSHDTIEMPAYYSLTDANSNLAYPDVAVRPESIWTGLNDFMLLMIWNGRLALYRSIHQTWYFIPPHICVDVICYDREFYALQNTGCTFMVNADCTTEEVVGPIVGVNGHKKSFVESGGNLLLVDQYYMNPEDDTPNLRRTLRFVVFRFERAEKTWVRIHTLSERVLFIGYYHRFSAAAADVAGARGDLIYFAEAYAYQNAAYQNAVQNDGNVDQNVVQNDDNVEDREGDDLFGFRREDISIFDMVDGITKRLRSPGGAQYAACFWPPPAWTLHLV